MSDFYTQFLLSVLGNTAVTGTIAYLAKKYVDRLIAHETKRMEAELKIKTDTAIALNAAELQRRNVEHQVRFSKLHERRLEVIAHLYKHIANALRASNDFVGINREDHLKDFQSLAHKAKEAIFDLSSYFDENQIYLPSSVQEQVDLLVHRLDSEVFRVAVYYDDLATSVDSAEGEPGIDLTKWKHQKSTARVQGWQEISRLGLTLRRSVESEFRCLLDAQ